MPLSSLAVEQFLSARIGSITSVGAADLSAELARSATWLDSYALQVVFNDHPPSHLRSLVVHLLRRIDSAVVEYARLREELQHVVASRSWTAYCRAMNHAEQVCAALYQSCDMVRKFGRGQLFTSGDGSTLDRLNKLYNDSRHGTLSREIIWIGNTGIESERGGVSFFEVEELLCACAAVADVLLQPLLFEAEQAKFASGLK
jgi:hypothetical protein